MTDRVKGFVVTLESDIRVDDVEPLRVAITAFRGVVDVAPVVTEIDDYMNRERVRRELAARMLRVLYPEREVSDDD